jgi:hypothetical protein
VVVLALLPRICHTTITPNSGGVAPVPRHHIVRLVAWKGTPPYRSFSGVVAHATVSCVQWIIFVSRREIFNFQERENENVDLKRILIRIYNFIYIYTRYL